MTLIPGTYTAATKPPVILLEQIEDFARYRVGHTPVKLTLAFVLDDYLRKHRYRWRHGLGANRGGRVG